MKIRIRFSAKRICSANQSLEKLVTSELIDQSTNLFNISLICSKLFNIDMPKKFNLIDLNDIIGEGGHKFGGGGVASKQAHRLVF